MTLRAKSSVLIVIFLVSNGVLAADKTVTLKVDNMSCGSCVPIVKKSLHQVPGVGQVAVSQEQKTATVTYDDTKCSLKALTAATTNAGYPSRLAGQE